VSEANPLDKVGTRFGNLDDLPESLRSQIVKTRLDDLDAKIVKTLSSRFDGVANVDELMVGLYRDHQYVTEDRKFLANKLYRMQKSGVIDSVEKRRGVYKIKESENGEL
jgi:hypothetical protein